LFEVGDLLLHFAGRLFVLLLDLLELLLQVIGLLLGCGGEGG
jgi:hypothetical protein